MKSKNGSYIKGI